MSNEQGATKELKVEDALQFLDSVCVHRVTVISHTHMLQLNSTQIHSYSQSHFQGAAGALKMTQLLAIFHMASILSASTCLVTSSLTIPSTLTPQVKQTYTDNPSVCM